MKRILLISIFTFLSLNILVESSEMEVHALDADKYRLIYITESKADDTFSANLTDLDINQDGFLSRLGLGSNAEKKLLKQLFNS
jgi:hypothetical protein